MTRPRQILAELLATLDGSFDVDSLIERLPVKGAPDYVSRPSIYRTLAELVDCGLLLVSENNGRTIYRLQT